MKLYTLYNSKIDKIFTTQGNILQTNVNINNSYTDINKTIWLARLLCYNLERSKNEENHPFHNININFFDFSILEIDKNTDTDFTVIVSIPVAYYLNEIKRFKF